MDSSSTSASCVGSNPTAVIFTAAKVAASAPLLASAPAPNLEAEGEQQAESLRKCQLWGSNPRPHRLAPEASAFDSSAKLSDAHAAPLLAASLPPHLFSRKLPPSLNHTRRYAKWVIKNQISKHARGHEFHWNVERSSPRSKPPMERRPLLGAPPTAGPQQKYTPCGTRTRNLRIRSPTPCPLGQGGH